MTDGPFLREYGTGTGANVCIHMLKAGSADQAVSADWTPAAGDVKVSKDGGAAANIGTLPVAVVQGNGAIWKFVFTDAELTAKEIVVTIADSASKAVADNGFVINTFGSTSAVIPLGADSIAAGSIQSAAYTAIGASVASDVLDAFEADHLVTGTIGAAIAAGTTSSASAVTALGSLATAVAALPSLAAMVGALGYIAGLSPGGAATNALKLASTASAADNAYAGKLVVAVDGAGFGQAQVCESYVGATRTCVFPDVWPVPVDGTTHYAVLL